MESQVSYCEATDQPENVFIKDVITSETPHIASNQPAKKQTRQWAAWTRQEEESFFNALRQVGKNFEKITSRVQSKNKDQVRHYYYRLVRRMNKLLGPELYLDAKNSKDTNAAMLRWWSLLEKHSCKASKLHLKPRRFKIFLETLEHQLLKDRKKNIKKRPFHGENCSTTPSNAVSNQGRDACINLVLVDNQNTQNFGPGKGSSVRRSSPVKPARQRRRSGTTSTAAYKRWEKAAIAGVSLVADAAAHLEQTALDKLVDSVQYMHGNKDLDPVAKNTFPKNGTQHLTKLKLQLFPINEWIRRALEMDNHNPHLELTLRSRKKISSVLEHMNRKWGNSSVANGELTLLPYYAQNSSLENCQKWTQDSVLSAADVYHALGSPPVFRLRYGWFSDRREPPEPTRVLPGVPGTRDSGKSLDPNDDKLISMEWADSLTNISVGDLLSEVSHNIDADGTGPPLPPGPECLRQVPFSCDSFDAAIAAHLSKNLGNNNVQSTVVSSIWDAEETCDAFTFLKNDILNEKVETFKENCKQDAAMSLEYHREEEPMEDYPAEVHSMDKCRSDEIPEDGSGKDLRISEDGSGKDLRTLTDIYWPESLGPLDLDLPSCRYNNYDLILSDSLGGLTRILTNSLDAFQNCSFFGSEPREPASTTVGARETGSFPDQKVES